MPNGGAGAADPSSATGSLATNATNATHAAGADQPRLKGEGIGSQLIRRGASAGGLPSGPRYEIERMLGSGANGDVYAVVDRNLARPVAAKLLKRPATGEAGDIAKFVDEAQITARLDHPNVLPIHEIDLDEDGRPYFTMKRVQGQTLGSAIAAAENGQPGRIGAANGIVSIFIDLCQALSFAHHRHVVHQDVKPDNIMLGDFGEVLLLDWGSAISIGAGRKDSYATPLFMSPEQARLEVSTPASDIYCLGASLFQTLTLRVPTWSDDAEEFWQMKRAGVIQQPTSRERARIPAPLLSIATKALASAPRDRYASMDLMLSDLQHYQAGLAVSAHRDAWWQGLLRWYRRNRRVTWISAIAMALIALSAGMVWHERQRELASWIEVFAEDFSRPAAQVAGDWNGIIKPTVPEDHAFEAMPVTDPQHWRLDAGGITMTPGLNDLDLVCRRLFPGNLRVDWISTPLGDGSNSNSFLGSDRRSGYTFHIGGFADKTLVVLTHGPEYTRLDWSHIKPLRPGVPYRFCLEREDRRISLSIDGVRVIDYRSMGGMQAQDAATFGFDAYTMPLGISRVRVSTQPLPRLVSPLSVGDALFSLGNHAEALRRYAEVASAYPGTSLADMAAFDIALCTVRSGDPVHGRQQLVDFERNHPRHEMVPYSLWERLSLALRDHDEAERHRILDSLSGFQGSSVLKGVIAEASNAFLPILVENEVAEVGQNPFPPDLPERVLAAAADIRHWSALYHVPADDMKFLHDAPSALDAFGLHGAVLEHFRSVISSDVADTELYFMGRFDEIPAGSKSEGAFSSLCDQERYDEVVNADFPERLRAYARELRDERDFYASGPSPAQISAFAAKRRSDQEAAAQSILASGEVRPFLAARYLLQLGRYDELIERYPGRPAEIAAAALHILIDGDVGRGRALFRQLRTARPNYSDPHSFDCSFAQAFVPIALAIDAGEPVDLPRELASARASDQVYQKRLSYMAELLVGAIDRERFLAQPVKRGVKMRLALVDGLLAELRHDAAAATAAYATIPPSGFEPDTVHEFAVWRIKQLGTTPSLP